MRTSVYFAGSAANKRYIQDQWIARARDKNYKVTFDWTKESGANPEELSRKCIDGVIRANFVVAIMNKKFTKKHAYRGTFFELGLAWGVGIPIIILIDPAAVKFPSHTGAPTMIWAPGVRHFHQESKVWEAMEHLSASRANYLAGLSVPGSGDKGGCHPGCCISDTSEPGKEHPGSHRPLVPRGVRSPPFAEKSEGPRTQGKL